MIRLCPLLTVLIIALQIQVGCAQDQLATAIEKIAKNEALYENVEVAWTSIYQEGDPKFRLEDTLTAREQRGRYVRQNGMFRLEFSEERRSNVAEQSESIKMGFDGAETRVLTKRGGQIANRVMGFRDNYNKFQPHTLWFRYKQYTVPLSVWLQGTEAIAAHPGAKIDRDYDHQVTWLRRDVFEGMPCEVISSNSFNRGGSAEKVVGRRELWLAVERNYLPVKEERFSLGASANIPTEQMFLTDLVELSPGVWYPFKARMIRYDDQALKEDGKHVISWAEDHLVESANLHPQYDIAYFRDIPFPEGVPVYEVTNNKITKSYVQGGNPSPKPADGPGPAAP